VVGGLTMTRIRPSRPDEAGRLFEIWRGAVEATHHFLPVDAASAIAASVRDEYLPGAELWVAEDEGGRPLAFMGMTGNSVDSLFVDPACHGRGIGRALIAHARGAAGPLKVDVNEQNPGALAFYLSLGFRIEGRSGTDSGGRPFPILHLAEGPEAESAGGEG